MLFTAADTLSMPCAGSAEGYAISVTIFPAFSVSEATLEKAGPVMETG
ncbi:MAG: hypothetical protein AB7S75_02380 [Desulfococcaceae bacterium]